MKNRFRWILFLCVLAGFFGTRGREVFAQPPDLPPGSSADILESHSRKEYAKKVLEEKTPEEVEVKSEKPAPPKKENFKFYVKKIALEPTSDVIPLAEFEPIMAEYENKEITFNDVSSLNRRLEQKYRSHGYFAVVYAPPQRLEYNEVKLKAVLARMGTLQIEGGKYYRKWKTRSYWEIPAGELLQYDRIKKSIVAMNENPDRTVKTILRAGKETETTDVILNVEDHFPVHGGYSLDNRGVKLTGKIRNGFTVRHNNFLGLDDIFLTGTVFSRSFGAVFLQHLIPLNSHGTRFVWGFSHSQVNPKKEFEIFGINGISQNYSLALRQKFFNATHFSGDGYLGFDFKEKRTKVLSATSVWDRLRVLSTGFNLRARDKTGIWTASQDFFFGLPLRGDGNPLSSRGGASSFVKYAFSLERQQKLFLGTRAIARVEGQLSPDRLVSQEQQFFGGVNGVRGYPESDFGADQGILSTFEYWIPLSFIPNTLHLPYDSQPLSERIRIFGFVDHGYGSIHNPGETEVHARHLLGVGGGLSISFRNNLSGQAEWGVPLGDRPITESGPSQFYFRLKADT